MPWRLHAALQARAVEQVRLRWLHSLPLLSLTLLALAACSSAPPTVGVVDTGARPDAYTGRHCHAHPHTYADPCGNPNPDSHPYRYRGERS